ncbi:hypothetical protein [Sporosarcina sp. P2]|uniref:hypothetical protein n=1 Tax=Sporosarcina sp. P2 TaxID=2048251 RepID=UPI001E3190D2|nr:hypothetical protein [Sporosarcina sp. P2]
MVATYIDAGTKQLAKIKVIDWFGENVVKDTESLDDEMEKKLQDRREKKEMKNENKKVKENIKALKKGNKKDRINTND